MMLAVFEILIGLAILGWSADRMVDNASDIARHYGMSNLMIGLTIVAFGTSAPEMIVSIIAVLSGSGALSVGNALGSNIANIGLILGIAALIAPLKLDKRLCKKELPLLMILTIGAGFFLLDLKLTWLEGLLLLTGQGVFFGLLYTISRTDGALEPQTQIDDTQQNALESQSAAQEVAQESSSNLPISNLWIHLAVNLSLLLLSSKILVIGASTLAELIGVPESVIGVTIVALGTSLPELAATLASIKKNQHDMAVGNIIGSNIMNLTLVLSMAGLLRQTTVAAEVATRDYGIALLLTTSLFLVSFFSLKKGHLEKWNGAFWIITYLLYITYLAIQNYHVALN